MIRSLNEKQRDNSARLLYDLIKLVFLGFVVGGFVSERGPNILQVGLGFALIVVFYVVALWLERKK